MAVGGCEIAVVGAGVAGLAAAVALTRLGARVTVFEAVADRAEAGAGLQIGPNGVAVLAALGLYEAAAAAASRPEAIELRDHAGRIVARIPLGEACVARYGWPYWQLHRADLVSILARAAADAGAALRPGVRVASLAACRDGVRLDLGPAGVARAEAAVGADGLRSAIRAAHFGGRPPRFTGHVAWRGLAPADRLPAGLFPDSACVMMGPGRHLVTYPLRDGGLLNFVAVEERAAWTPESWTTPDAPEALRRSFAGWTPAVTKLLDAVERPYLWGLFAHPPLPAWARGRIVLIGDACHPMLPFLAQGAAMALEDAWVLGASLAAAVDLPAGLKAYERRRQARCGRVQRAAARNGALYHLANPGVRAAAHLGLRAAAALLPGGLLARFDWLYGTDVTDAFAP